MKTKQIYNYRSADIELGNKIDSLANKVGLSGTETLDEKIRESVRSAVSTEQAEREDKDESLERRMDQLETEVYVRNSTYYEAGEPDMEMEPFSTWEPEEYDYHIGDLYYDAEAGIWYRFNYEETEYMWVQVRNGGVTEALANAEAAQRAANAAIPKAQGVDKAGQHLVVGPDGNVTAEVPEAILLRGADDLSTYAIKIGENGALTVNRVVSDDENGA